VIQTAWLFALLAAFMILRKAPDWSIVSGHFVLGAFLTPVLMCCICWLAFHTDRRVRMGWPAAVGLIGSMVTILGVVAYAGMVILTGGE